MSDSGASKRGEHLFHITTEDAWERAQTDGEYSDESLATEGFIHCSLHGQVRATWRRVFASAPGLVVLTLDPGRVDAEVRLEDGEPGEMFPHVYGPIPVRAVTAIRRPEEF